MRKFFFSFILVIFLALSINYTLAQQAKKQVSSFEKQEPFKLATEILNKYPNLQSLPEDIRLTVSATYMNVRIAERFLVNVQSGIPTGNVEDLLQFVGETIDKLKKSKDKLKKYNNPILDKFIEDHKAKLSDVSKKAKQIIGNKKRRQDSIYK